MSTMLIGRERRAFVIVESELDAIAVAAASDLAGAVALGSVFAKPDAETFAVLKKSLQILNALDYDTAGAKAMEWWGDNFAHHDRWPVPKGKDPGEAVQMGIALDQWIKAGLPPAVTIVAPQKAPPQNLPDGPVRSRQTGAESPEPPAALQSPPEDLPAPVRELCALLQKNPAVTIINTPGRYTVLRGGKYVGGRINKLVFKSPEVLEYISNHPAEEITWRNILCQT